MEWQDIQKFHLNPPPHMSYFPRKPEIRRIYYEHKAQIQCMSEYLLIKNFDTSEKIAQGWVISQNDYPYDLAPGILHLILWIHPSIQMTDKQIYICIETYMYQHNYKDYIYYRNNTIVRSIHDIDHFQIFVKI